jgi:hypothetical protein
LPCPGPVLRPWRGCRAQVWTRRPQVPNILFEDF